MKYVSLDIETTCLDPKPSNILGLSMVVEDSDHPEVAVEDLPHLTVIIDQPVITGQAYALGLNGWILDFISGRSKNCPYKIIKPSELHYEVGCFLRAQFPDRVFKTETNVYYAKKRLTLAGKNVASFDYQFLPDDVKLFFAHRMIDPGSVMINWNLAVPPSLGELLKVVGIDKEVSHDMLDDARDVIRVLRATY